MTSSNRLIRLKISGLRGVSTPLVIPFEKPLTLIYGENGTGKTSICDALDFLGNGKVGSVVDIGLGSNVHQYWPFLGKDPADISVILDAENANSWAATTSGRSVTVQPVTEKPVVKIWRRSALYKLILDKPANRFQIIEPFIDLAEIDRAEEKLRRLRDSLSDSLNDAGIRLAENRESIAGLMLTMNGGNEDVIEWARNELQTQEADVDEEINFLARAEELIAKIISDIKSLTIQAESLEQQEFAESAAKESHDIVLSQLEAGAEEALSILQASQAYFHSHENIETCPLCQSKENVEGLSERTDSAIEDYTNLQNTQRDLTSAIQNKSRAAERLAESQKSVSSGVRQLQEHYNGKEIPVELNSCLNELCDLKVDQPNDQLEAVKNSLSLSRQALVTSKANRDELARALQQHDSNLELQFESEQQLPVVRRLHEIHEQARKAFIDQVLDSIADEVGRLYEAIHEGEGLNQIALKLHSDRRASLDISSGFLNEDVPPGAYFSNSHVDSLGLCILIALAKLEQPENTILVMDDILGSIDEPHFDRMVKLIYEESTNFLQTIITTHYQAWHHKIRRGQLRNADCSMVELRKWDSQKGVSIQASSRPLVEILRSNIADNPGEVEPIAANAGHLLEQVGDFLTMKYQCSVPRRENGNTLNDYLDGLKSSLTNQLKVEVLQDDGNYKELLLGPIIGELKEIYRVRNTSGAHYNELASHLPQSDVLQFGELVLQLCDAVICPQHGLPIKARSGSYWSPPNQQTRRLFPFAKP